MDYNPAAMVPALNGCIRRRVFISHIYRRPIAVIFRGVQYTAAKNEPSMQRKIMQAGYTQEMSDLEIMLALPTGTAAPVANSADCVLIGATTYRVTNVQTDLAPDCYHLTLSIRRS
jgi:hypothetical protein